MPCHIAGVTRYGNLVFTSLLRFFFADSFDLFRPGDEWRAERHQAATYRWRNVEHAIKGMKPKPRLPLPRETANMPRNWELESLGARALAGQNIRYPKVAGHRLMIDRIGLTILIGHRFNGRETSCAVAE